MKPMLSLFCLTLSLLTGCVIIPIPGGTITGPALTQLPDNRVVTVSDRAINVAEVERLVFELTNQERTSRGLSALNQDSRLADVARTHSQDMGTRHFFDHTNPDGRNAKARVDLAHPGAFRGIGENIYQFVSYEGTDADLAANLVKGWMNSPGHRDNILKPDYVTLGVGLAQQGRDLYATQVFGL